MPRLDMTHGARIASVGLLLLVLIVGAGNLWATYAENKSFQRQFTQQQEQQRTSQQQQGAATEHKLCSTLGKLAALKPPKIPANSSDPSRQYIIDLHDTLSGLGPDIGCPG